MPVVITAPLPTTAIPGVAPKEPEGAAETEALDPFAAEEEPPLLWTGGGGWEALAVVEDGAVRALPGAV